MATVRPFAAVRPRPDLAASICELPYDVMSSEEARVMAQGRPLSFLRVSKPEIDLPKGTDPHDPAVYARGRENFEALRRQGQLIQEDRPAFYLYRQSMGAHTQTGIVATFSCEEYLDGRIRRHELTRPDKEDDRVRHVEALSAQTGPAFLTYRARPALDELVAKAAGRAPDVDFVASDGIRHSGWVVKDEAVLRAIEEQFREVPRLYIADGHHRTAAAGRVYKARGGRGGSDRFLAVVFPHDQLQILPYHRVVRDLQGQSYEVFLEKVKRACEVTIPGRATPGRRREVGLYAAGRWVSLRFQDAAAALGTALDQLDVALLQRQVLAPLLGIQDPRRSERIGFVGGVRGTGELERLVDGGGFACAFSLYPTGIDELMEIADADGIMPPKSTWFEPKLRDGMFSHVLEPAGRARVG